VSTDPAGPRAWQRMLSGRRLDLLHPAPRDVEIEDIAHGLARVARWNGQTEGSNIFSVAQHSVLVERLASLIAPGLTAAERLAALLHDSPEYVIGDLISPFKVVLGDGYKAIERRLLDAIHARFDLPVAGAALSDVIKRADKVAAYWEATQLAGFSEEEADRILGRPPYDLPLDAMPLQPQSSQEAEQAFLARFVTLRGSPPPAGPPS
jgi:5'-deoxynucleotidase YfbR-like HD superfamily hydrolase